MSRLFASLKYQTNMKIKKVLQKRYLCKFPMISISFKLNKYLQQLYIYIKIVQIVNGIDALASQGIQGIKYLENCVYWNL